MGLPFGGDSPDLVGPSFPGSRQTWIVAANRRQRVNRQADEPQDNGYVTFDDATSCIPVVP